MTFLGAMLSLLLPRSAWRVIQRRTRTGWRQDQFLENAEVGREGQRAFVGVCNASVCPGLFLFRKIVGVCERVRLHATTGFPRKARGYDEFRVRSRADRQE